MIALLHESASQVSNVAHGSLKVTIPFLLTLLTFLFVPVGGTYVFLHW